MSSPSPLPNAADGRRFWCHQCRAEIRPSSDFACLGCGNDFIEELEDSAEDDPTAFVAFDQPAMTTPQQTTALPHQPPLLFPFAQPAQFQTMFGGNPGMAPLHQQQHYTQPAPLDFAQLVQQVDTMMHQMAAVSPQQQQQQPAMPPIMQVFSTGGGAVPPMNFQAFMQSMLSGLNGGQMVGNPGDYAFGSLDNIITRLMETAGDRGPPPAAKDVVESLPSVRISQDAVDAHEDCAICKDEYTVGEEALKLSCDHRFHPTCIKEWLGMRNTCPVCRFELKAAEKPSSTKGNGGNSGEGNSNNRRGGGGGSGGRGGNSNENNAADSPFQFYL